MTKKIESLTPEQEALIPVVRDEWLDKFFSLPRIDREKARKLYAFIYELASLEAPTLITVDSPLAAQLLVSKMKNVAGFEVKDSYEDCPLEEMKAGATIGTSYEAFSSYGSSSCFDWVAFYDFFDRIGCDVTERFKFYRDHIDCGVFSSIQLRKYAILVSNPFVIHRDEEHNLHSVEGSAIEWKDGFKLHYVNGIHFEEDVYKRCIGGEANAKEILALSNIEQRMVALKHYGNEKLLQELDAKLLHKSKRGNEMWYFPDLAGEPAWALKYSCPSTGREYVSFVEPEVAREHNEDPDACMGARWGLSPEQYAELRHES